MITDGKWALTRAIIDDAAECALIVLDWIFQIERENIEYYGYGIKGSILSLLVISARTFNNQFEIDEISRTIKIV